MQASTLQCKHCGTVVFLRPQWLIRFNSLPAVAVSKLPPRVSQACPSALGQEGVQVGLGVPVEQAARHAAQLVDHVNAEVACEAVHLPLRLRVAAKSGRLQGVRHEEPVSRVQRPTAAAQVLRGMVGLRRGTEALGAEVGLRERLVVQQRLGQEDAPLPRTSGRLRNSGDARLRSTGTLRLQRHEAELGRQRQGKLNEFWAKLQRQGKLKLKDSEEF